VPRQVEETAMDRYGQGRDAAVQHLQEAIEQVTRDMAVVEFWADAVAGFSQPVPDYEPGHVNVWMPPEQARRLHR
jgi:hypothetical protein